MYLRDQFARRDPILVSSTPYTATVNGLYHVDASGGSVVFDLPTAVGDDGQFLCIRKTDSAATTVTITPSSGQTIDGFASIILYRQFDAYYLTSRNGVWFGVDNFLTLRYLQDNLAVPQTFNPATMNNQSLYTQLSALNGRANDSNFSFFDTAGAKDYILMNTKDTWVSFATFLFRGTNVWTPARLSAILAREGASGQSELRIVDLTNANNLICTLTWTSATQAIYTTAPLTNLPATQATFNFQGRKTGAGSPSGGRIHAAGLYPI